MELFFSWLHHMFILNKKLVGSNVSKSKNQEKNPFDLQTRDLCYEAIFEFNLCEYTAYISYYI